MEIKDNSSPDPSSVRATMESEKEGRDGDIIYCRAPREGIGESIRGNGIFGIAPEREWGGVKGGDFWLSLPKSIGGEMSGGMACCCVWLSKAETVPPCFSLRTGKNWMTIFTLPRSLFGEERKFPSTLSASLFCPLMSCRKGRAGKRQHRN